MDGAGSNARAASEASVVTSSDLTLRVITITPKKTRIYWSNYGRVRRADGAVLAAGECHEVLCSVLMITCSQPFGLESTSRRISRFKSHQQYLGRVESLTQCRCSARVFVDTQGLNTKL